MASALLAREPLGFPWKTADPFLFCVHHRDAYPAGNEEQGPNASLEGRNIGMDFEVKDGFRMYHGKRVPGFPQHPHRGFETVTIVRRGVIDHSDSLGAAARFGGGDVQWLTAGSGILHSEMFPLRNRDEPNPLELFQIWLNLPSRDKFVVPYFSMLWSGDIPRPTFPDERGRVTEISVVAGRLLSTEAPAPPPNSWAARAESDVAIWCLRMQPGAKCTVPAAKPETRRTLYFFDGDSLRVQGEPIDAHAMLSVQSHLALDLEAGQEDCELLLLQGQPIGEPVVQYGPFVMNSPQQVREAMVDYQRTRFGGWPWPSDEPVHPRESKRFARYADGRTELAQGSDSPA